MIAVVSNRDDLTADWLGLELERRGTDWTRINTEDFPARMALEWHGCDATLCSDAWELEASAISAIWWRRPVFGRTSEGRSAPEEAWAARESSAAFYGFLAMANARWVNHPANNAIADNKPEQLIRARQLGLEIPRTVITNSVQTAQRFVAAHGHVVAKAIADGRVPDREGARRAFPTVRLSNDDIDALAQLGPEPLLMQALVTKAADLRVTIVGEELFACEIRSQADPAGRVDWRRGDVATMGHRMVDLPTQVKSQCQELARQYGLRFAAIDLAQTPDGAHVFFEINPNGQWAWVEQRTGAPLRSALADELMAVPNRTP